MEGVQLEDNTFLGQTCHRGGDTASCGQIHFPVFFDGAHLDNCPIDIAQETIAEVLCHHAKVNIVVCNLTSVDMLAEG